ncbi:sugar ABC transporter substrate-binding protein [Mesorhizobium sp.]|uniref:sugar ABC transporter substrate-binding protein n=1 Tax=Mesorhizobium sp. TaxID=1871066 RepID=UPI0011FC9151|nr:sugar ABC transporter substrate-binding protein [Mesorhizobium sp.]TIO09991.1 MAG: sugar ABC transporter substrate-binding protein [Mesorhizobium sp.]TIO32499.1 MAG: sugar ABC transporter substrate-binding protein [Mesorhizobium sp.]
MSHKQSRSHSILKAAAIALTAACSVQFVISAAQAEELSLKGKRIGVSIVGTDHYWDLMAFRGIQDEIKALGGEAIALDAGRKDQQQIAQLQTLIAQKPDAIVEVLGNLEVLNPWLAKIREAEIPLFTVDTATPHAINNTTSNNYNIGAEIALQMVADMGGKGNVLVFNGFYSVPVCKIRYDQMKYVLTSFPDVKIVEPELRDVIPNTVQAAYSNVTDMLTKSPEKGSLNAVWACWDVPQIGATQAAEAAGRPELKTYGIDGSPEVIKMVMDENSPAAAVAAQQPYEIGKTSVQNVAKFLAGQKVPPFTFVPAVLINKENAAVTGKPFLEAAEKAGVK